MASASASVPPEVNTTPMGGSPDPRVPPTRRHDSNEYAPGFPTAGPMDTGWIAQQVHRGQRGRPRFRP